jgi:SAM-dependent methyltransferase
MSDDAQEPGDGDQEAPNHRATSTCGFPASYSAEILESIRRLTPANAVRILDPFAGPNGIARLQDTLGTFSNSTGRRYLGVEIEPEWAKQGVDTIVGDATKLREMPGVVAFAPDMVVTSPPYGNRMADQYLGDAKGSRRHTYAIALGRTLDYGSMARYQWGPRYQTIFSEGVREIYGILPVGGHFILNIANHYRKHQLQLVVPWAVERVLARPFELRSWDSVKARKMRHGENHEVRDDYEQVFLFEKTA